MKLNVSQLSQLRADIATNSDTNTIPNTQDGAIAIAALYNVDAVPATQVWRTDAPVSAIFDSITWANYTPNDAADATTVYTNRTLVAQTKQMNLQNMLIGRDVINAAKVNVRAGLRDAVIQLPTGVAGALTTAGGVNGATTLAACIRNATRAEKLFLAASQGSDTTGVTTARVLTLEGPLSADDVYNARAN